MGMSNSINPSGGVAIGGKTATISSGASGALYALGAPLRGLITWTKVSGHANLSVSGSKIGLAAAIASGTSQTIVVRGSNGSSAVEFAVTLKSPSGGVAPVPVAAIYGATASADGSTGQAYAAPAGITGHQWYRMSTVSPFTETIIPGANGSTYVAQAADEGARLVVKGMSGDSAVAYKSYHVVSPRPMLIEGFENPADWTLTAGAVVSSDTTDKVQGTASLVMSATGTASAKIQKSSSLTAAPKDFGIVSFMADLGQEAERQSLSNLRMSLVYNGAEQYVANVTTLGTSYQTPSTQFLGRYWNSYNVSEVAGLAAAESGTVGVAVTHSGNTPNIATTKLDAYMARSGGRPVVILGFDDLKVTQYTTAFPYMQARGIKGSVHVVKNYIGLDGTRMTLAQIQELYAAGWDACLNGSIDDGPMTGKASVAAAIAELDDCRTYLEGLGMTRGNEHFCYPNGTYQVPGAKILPSGNVTSTGTEVVTMGSTAGIMAGMLAVGFNVPANTRVLSVNSATQVTLTAAVPAQAKPMSFTNDNGPFHTMKLPLAIAADGRYRTGRTTLNRNGVHTRFGVGGRGLVMHGNGITGRTLANITAAVDQAVLRGQTIEFYTHGVLPVESGIDASEANFFGLIDYIVGLRDAGVLDIMTKSEWWSRDGGASVPL